MRYKGKDDIKSYRLYKGKYDDVNEGIFKCKCELKPCFPVLSLTKLRPDCACHVGHGGELSLFEQRDWGVQQKLAIDPWFEQGVYFYALLNNLSIKYQSKDNEWYWTVLRPHHGYCLAYIRCKLALKDMENMSKMSIFFISNFETQALRAHNVYGLI